MQDICYTLPVAGVTPVASLSVFQPEGAIVSKPKSQSAHVTVVNLDFEGSEDTIRLARGTGRTVTVMLRNYGVTDGQLVHERGARTQIELTPIKLEDQRDGHVHVGGNSEDQPRRKAYPVTVPGTDLTMYLSRGGDGKWLLLCGGTQHCGLCSAQKAIDLQARPAKTEATTTGKPEGKGKKRKKDRKDKVLAASA
jgi:hypothetical protein